MVGVGLGRDDEVINTFHADIEMVHEFNHGVATHQHHTCWHHPEQQATDINVKPRHKPQHLKIQIEMRERGI